MTARPIRRNAQTPDRNGKIFYTSTTSLSHISKDAGIEVPCRLDMPQEDIVRLERLGDCAYPQGEENTLEEFVWAFGKDSEKEIEKRALYVISLIRTMDDVVKLSEQGVDKLVSSWGFLGNLDEDLLLRSIEEHIGDFPEQLSGEEEQIAGLIDNRRKRLREKLLNEHPEMTEYLEESREHRITASSASLSIPEAVQSL